MSLFTLPIAPSAIVPTSRAPSFSSPRSRKRKRATSRTSTSSSSDNDKPPLRDRRDSSPLPAASTNPLSLTPSELIQYRLAGLELNQELPSKAVRDYPHRPLPFDTSLYWKARPRSRSKSRSRRSDVGDDESEVAWRGDSDGEREEQVEKTQKEHNPKLRMKHLAVLTTILQRCLLEGDMPRATRAWAMLLRVQVGGKGIDIRGSAYWGIGAELLIRGQNGRVRRNSHSDDEDEDEEEKPGLKDAGNDSGERRWGTAEGLEKAKEYYERLVLQYPYNRHFHDSVSALDFWPAMFGCEIYGIQFEQKDLLARALKAEEADDGDDEESQAEEIEEDVDAEVEVEAEAAGGYATRERRGMRRRKQRAERRWKERDGIRQTALIAAEKLAGRMDQLMATPPFSDSQALLRLRGMIALYIGDLSVPALPDDSEDDEDRGREEELLDHRRRLSTGEEMVERRFVRRERTTAHKRGKDLQGEESMKARKLFERVGRAGGRIDRSMRVVSIVDDHIDDLYSADS